jgi:hypothetical protein
MADLDTEADRSAKAGLLASNLVRSAWMRRIGLIVGALLLSAAIMMVWRQREAVSVALSSIQDRPAGGVVWLLGLAAASILVNIILTGWTFSLLISRHGKVGVVEMQALIAVSTLMNFLPMRPGLFGRVAYHKVFNNIAVRHSASVVLQAMAISFAVSLCLALAVMLHNAYGHSITVLALLPLPVLGVAGAIWERGRVWCWAAAIRFSEVIVIAVRYAVVFDLLGSPIASDTAIAFACISVLATMVPFLSSGLGLREWAIGLAAPLLTAYEMELAITADLLIRFIEVAITCAAGGLGFVWLARHQRIGRAS